MKKGYISFVHLYEVYFSICLFKMSNRLSKYCSYLRHHLTIHPCICLFGCFSLFVFAFTAICPHHRKATRQDGVRLRECFGVDHSTECRVSSLSHTSWLSARASRHEQPSWGRPTAPLTTTTTPHKEKGRSGLEGRRGGEQKMERWWWVGGAVEQGGAAKK